jgi:hypothetical protein
LYSPKNRKKREVAMRTTAIVLREEGAAIKKVV